MVKESNKQQVSEGKEEPRVDFSEQAEALNTYSTAQLLQTIFAQDKWLTAKEVSERAGYAGINPSSQPSKWKRSGKVFALTCQGKSRFPSYAFGDDGKPVKALSEIIRIFRDAGRSDISLALWFISINSWLSGYTAKSMLKKYPDAVIGAAHKEVLGSGHG
ncbi:hypothetical protein [Alteromonas sp. CYL-A6]|uniref:hypothetical protein n=1 Tax=Alteromonas nitratireducens TaxID=3390813 RepID=UPI0034B7AFC3